MYMPENPVLVVIDMQNGFLGEKSRHVYFERRTLLMECQRRSIPLIFTRFYNLAMEVRSKR